MRAILTAAGMAATILVVSHGPAASQDAETEKLVRPVKMIEIAERATLLRFTQPTVIEPDVSADLTIQVGGVLEELPVREGMSVKQGDLIAQVDPLILENDVNQAAAQLEQAEIEFRRAQTLLQVQRNNHPALFLGATELTPFEVQHLFGLSRQQGGFLRQMP